MTGKVTLKDIAEKVGFTTTTIHRALHGKEGVSEGTRQEVQAVAARMGYRTNYMAAALKRKKVRIAIALPEPTDDNRYYYGNMWLGVRSFLAEVTEDFNVIPLDYTYPFTHGANGNVLKTIYENYGNDLDGLLTMGVDQGLSSCYIQRFAEKNIPIVFVGNDLYKDIRLCCVKSLDEMAGSLAAELLSAFNMDNTKKKVITIGHFGQLGMTDQLLNATGFDDYVKAHAPHLSTIHIRNGDHRAACLQLSRMLKDTPDIYAIYSSSARYTVYVGQIVKEMGLAGKLRLIGNDCFNESRALLQEGVLSAIIDKRIARQSYLAMKTLFNYVVKDEAPRNSLLQLSPEVILRSHYDKALVSGGLQIGEGDKHPDGELPE